MYIPEFTIDISKEHCYRLPHKINSKQYLLIQHKF